MKTMRCLLKLAFLVIGIFAISRCPSHSAFRDIPREVIQVARAAGCVLVTITAFMEMRR